MKFNYIKIDNFCSITEAEIQFAKGINVFSGANGQGKTTIYKAIALLLFNWTEKGAKFESYLNWNTDKNYYELALDLEHKGKHFLIEYKYSEKEGAYRKVMIDNEVFEGNTEAVNELKEYFDPKITLNSLISFHGDSDLTQIKPAERREQLKKIRNLQFNREIRNIEDTIAQLEKTDLKEIEQNIAILENKEYNFQEELKLPFDNDTLISYSSEIEKLDKKIFTIKENLNKVKQVQTEKEEVDKSLKDLVSKIALKQSQLSHEKELLIKHKEELADFDIIHEKNCLEVKEKLKQDFFAEVNSLIKQKEVIVVKRIPIFQNSLLEDTQKEKNEIEINIKTCKQNIETFKTGKCPTCGQEVDDVGHKFQEELKDYENKLETINKKVSELKEQKKDLETKQEESRKNIELKKELDSKISNAQFKAETNKKELKTELKSLTENAEIKKASIIDLISIVEKNIEAILIDIEAMDINKGKLVKKQEKLETELKHVSTDDPKEFEEKKNQLKSKIDNYKEILSNNKLKKELNEKLEKEEKEDSKKLKGLFEQRDSLIADIKEWKEARTILQKSLPNFILSTLLKEIEKRMNTFIEQVYEGRYIISIEEKKDSILVLYGPKKQDVSLGSGFEKAIFSLGYKDALNRMQKLNSLLLDEADSNADDEHCVKVYTYVAELSQRYEQMFVITHREMIKDILVNDYHATIFEISEGSVFKQ